MSKIRKKNYVAFVLAVCLCAGTFVMTLTTNAKAASESSDEMI